MTDPKTPGPGAGEAVLGSTAHEHGVSGYRVDQAVGGFGEGYSGQVAHGSEPDLPEGSPEDEVLAHAIRHQLGHAHIDAADLRVEVKAGQATLWGSVRHVYEKAQLEARTRAVPGVASLVSHLSVLNGLPSSR